MHPWIRFLVTLAFGPLGLHRFLTGRALSGLCMLLSFGGVGLWYLADLLIALKDGVSYLRIKRKAAKRRFSLHKQ